MVGLNNYRILRRLFSDNGSGNKREETPGQAQTEKPGAPRADEHKSQGIATKK